MFGILEELINLADNTVKIVCAPIEIALHIVNTPLEQIAEASQDIVDNVKS